MQIQQTLNTFNELKSDEQNFKKDLNLQSLFILDKNQIVEKIFLSLK
jgi:hypothetical protein